MNRQIWFISIFVLLRNILAFHRFDHIYDWVPDRVCFIRHFFWWGCCWRTAAVQTELVGGLRMELSQVEINRIAYLGGALSTWKHFLWWFLWCSILLSSASMFIVIGWSEYRLRFEFTLWKTTCSTFCALKCN